MRFNPYACHCTDCQRRTGSACVQRTGPEVDQSQTTIVGISEDLITGLSHIRWLFVIARNSTFVYKRRAVDVKQVSRELGVRYVLEGSVRRAGKRLRISAQLIEART